MSPIIRQKIYQYSKKEQGEDKDTKIWKVAEDRTTEKYFEARDHEWGGKQSREGVTHIGRKVYRPPTPSSYKEI